MESWQIIAIVAVVVIILVVIFVKSSKNKKRRHEDAHNPAEDMPKAPVAEPEAPVYPEAPAPMAEDPEIARAAEDDGPIILG